MKVCATMKKFPGGMVIVSLLLGCTINTFIPQVLETGGSTTRLPKNGTSALAGLFTLCNGVTISFKQAGMPLYKGIALTVLKYIIGVLIGWRLNRVLGPVGILGLTPLAVTTAVANSNGAIYTALVKEFSDFTDVGTITILLLSDGPFLTMITLGATGLTEIPLVSIIVVTVLLSTSMFLGNTDEGFKALLINGPAVLLPFNEFVLGANMSLMSIAKTGAGGTVLGLVTVVRTGVLTYYIYSATRRRPDPMGMAIKATGGNAVIMSAFVIVTDPSLNPAVEVAITQVVVSVVVSTILIPPLTRYSYGKAQKERVETSDK